MELSPISNTLSKLRFLNPNGEPITVPGEWQLAQVEILLPLDQWQEVNLYCQGQALEVYQKKVGGQPRIVAPWQRSSVGHYRLQLHSGKEIEDFSFALWPQKISRDAFATLLENLELQLPAAVAISLQRLGAFSGVNFRPPETSTLSGEWQRLRRAVEGSSNHPGLLRLLPQIAADPQIQLKTQIHWIHRDRVRRPAISTISQAFHNPCNLNSQGYPKKYPDSRVEPSVDGYENRLLKLFLQQVTLHCRRLLPGLEAKSELLYTEAANLYQKLQQVNQIHTTFLQSIRLPDHLPQTLTMVLLNRPSYRTMLERYLEFHRSIAVDLQEPLLEAPLENLPQLYQCWCVLQITTVLLDVAISQGYCLRHQQLVDRDRYGCHLVLRQGLSILTLGHPNGMQVELIPERTYGQSGDLQSSTGTHRPDAALEIRDPNGSYHVYLFDPKYKLESEQDANGTTISTPKKNDIDKMHVYRDAIRDRHGNCVVQYAAILYPGNSRRYDPAGIEAIEAKPDRLEELHQSLDRIIRMALTVV